MFVVSLGPGVSADIVSAPPVPVFPSCGSRFSAGGGGQDIMVLQAEATRYVVILDEGDQPTSPEVPVHFNPIEACWYRLNWQRTD